MLTDTGLIHARLQSATRGLEEVRRKIHTYRALVAGDRYAMQGFKSLDNRSNENRENRPTLDDIMVLSYYEGSSNHLLKNLRTLLFQVQHQAPDFEFDDLEPEDAMFHSAYLSHALGDAPFGCNAVEQFQIALLDMLIGGTGAIFAGTRPITGKQQPLLRYIDSLDLLWDQRQRLLVDAQWIACRFRQPYHVWARMFGEKALAGAEVRPREHAAQDDPIELQFYYDVYDEGTWAVFHAVSHDAVHEKPVLKARTKYLLHDVPFLPVEVAQLLVLPSVRAAAGLVETMAPHQMAIWDAEDRTRKDVKAQGQQYIVPAGLLSEEQLQQFRDGNSGGILEAQTAGQISVTPPIQPNTSVLEWMNHNIRQAQAQSGASSYATGEVVEGTQFAREVSALRADTTLVAGTIARINASLWSRACRMFLSVAKLYESRNFQMTMEGERIFLSAQEVRDFLRPDALPIVREESTQFMPQADRIAQKMSLLKLEMELAKLFPQGMPPGVAQAHELALLAFGQRNIKKFVAPVESLQDPTAPMQ